MLMKKKSIKTLNKAFKSQRLEEGVRYGDKVDSYVSLEFGINMLGVFCETSLWTTNEHERRMPAQWH